MDQAQHIIDYPPAVWNFKETWKQIVHYDARSLNAIERDGAVGKERQKGDEGVAYGIFREIGMSNKMSVVLFCPLAGGNALPKAPI